MMILFTAFSSLMRRAYVTVLLSLVAIVPAHATNVLLLGDSLSASYGMQASKGWAHLAELELQKTHPDFKLLNFSASGETTGGGKARLARLLEKNKVDVLWIELGGNDGLRGYPINTIRNNLSAMVKMGKDKGIKVIVTQIQIPPSMGKRYTSMFTGLYPKLAEQEQVTLMPFFIESVATNPELMQNDLIHPNEQAQPIIAKEVVAYFKDYLSK
ncbi:arylesterase [Psychrobium sp. MM17-31]|uniref:arylesterase n=1 Tax=Psychrobium sp. MM17-31 TaxID=2917758 RepID=UPI001EF46F47|nr:arylesterase [Psychrobium sp. MM17-31]MCG7530486.1 arylesterase [Psychrobium sp. MM17-31]